MKNIFNKYTLALASLLVLSSCADDDQPYPALDKPVATMTSANSFTITEGESAEITIQLDRAISVGSDFKIDLLSGGSLSDVDISGGHIDEFEVGPEGFQVTVPAYSDSVTFNLDAVLDIYPENTETMLFKITQGQQGNAIVSGNSIRFTVNVENFTSQLCAMLLEWDGAEDDHLCDMDFDVYLDTFAAYCFTGDCPELVSEPINPNNLWTSELADGTHLIVIDLWDSNGVDAGISVPLRLTIGKVGVVLGDLDLGGMYSTDSEYSANGGAGAMLAGWIEVAGGAYSIYDRFGELVAAE